MEVTSENFSAVLDDIIRGAVDQHVHFGPDISPTPKSLSVARRLDALQTAKACEEAGMAAIVLKAHWWPTGAVCRLVQNYTPNIRVLGMAVISYVNGGLSPVWVEMSAQLGCKVLMTPAIHTRQSIARRRANGEEAYGVRPDQDGISLIDDKEQLVPEMHEILDIAQQYNMVLASGHIQPPEDRVLVAEADKRGLRTVLTHQPPNRELLDDRKWMTQHGAVVEWGWNQLWHPMPAPDDFIAEAREIGLDLCCMTTDGGQAIKASPAETLREFAGRLIIAGMDPDEVKVMAQKTGQDVLGIDPADLNTAQTATA